MAPILDVSNPANWVPIYNITLYAQPIPGLTGRYYPIPSHFVPVSTDRRTLAVGASSTQAQSTWHTGFWLVGFVVIPGKGTTRIANFRIPFGLNLVRLPNLHNEFRLKIEVPKWQKELTVDIYKYIGVETDS